MPEEKIFMPKIEGIYPDLRAARLSMARHVGKFPPQKGGCWFCWKKDGELVYDIEFDTAVHVDCIKQVLEEEPGHPEANIMKYLLEEK